MAKILMLIEHFVPTIGGLENSTYRLANELGKQGHHVTVFTADRLTQDADSGNLVIKSTRCGTAAFAECLISSRNPREWDASIIFGVGHDEHLTHWKAVLSPSMPPAYLKVGTDGDLMRPYVTGKLLRSFKGILCQTGAIAAEARSYGISTDRIFLISNGIDVQEWRENLQERETARRFLGIPKENHVTLIIGRYVKRKAISEAIDAWCHFATKIPNATLIVHGSDFGQSDGCESAVVAKLQQSTLGSHIVRVTPETPNKISFSAANTLLSLATRDGAPNIFVEALASGLSLVASDLPGHGRYIEDGINGHVVTAQDTLQIYSALQNCLPSNMGREYEYQSRLKAARFDVKVTSGEYMRAIFAI